jgi:hypothetical protein
MRRLREDAILEVARGDDVDARPILSCGVETQGPVVGQPRAPLVVGETTPTSTSSGFSGLGRVQSVRKILESQSISMVRW